MVRSGRGIHGEYGVQEMNAAVRGPRSMPTWLTGTAGLLVLVLALVMMVMAAPTGASPAGHGRPASPHAAQQNPAQQDPAQQDPAQQPALGPAATLSVTARHVPGPPLTRHDRIVRDLSWIAGRAARTPSAARR